MRLDHKSATAGLTVAVATLLTLVASASASSPFWDLSGYLLSKGASQWVDYLGAHRRWFGAGCVPQYAAMVVPAAPVPRYIAPISIVPSPSSGSAPAMPAPAPAPAAPSAASNSSSVAIACGSDLVTHCVRACSQACSGVGANNTATACAQSCASGCTEPRIVDNCALPREGDPQKAEVCSVASAKSCSSYTQRYCTLGASLAQLGGNALSSAPSGYESPALVYRRCAYAVSLSCVRTVQLWDGETCVIAQSFSESFANEFAGLYIGL